MLCRASLALLLLVLLPVGPARAEDGPPVSPEAVREADDLAERAAAALGEGRREEAVALLRQAILLNPERLTPAKSRAADLLVAAGKEALQADRQDEARLLLEPAVRLNPYDPLAPFFLAQAEYNVAVRDRDRDGMERAKGYCRMVEARDPRFGGSFYLWALIGIAIADYDLAVEGFHGAIDRGYEVAQARAGLGQSLFFLGVRRSKEKGYSFESVIAVLEEAQDLLSALKDDEGYSAEQRENFKDLWLKSLVNLAAMHQKAEEPVAAEQILLRLAEVEPENYLHWFDLGLFYGQGMKYDKALEYYQKALDKCPDPDWVDPYPMLGYIHSQQGRPEQAEKYFLGYLEKLPDSWEGHFQYATFLSRAGRAKDAIVHFLRCIELDASRVASFREVSLALRKDRRPAEANQWLNLFRCLEQPASDGSRPGPPKGPGGEMRER